MPPVEGGAEHSHEDDGRSNDATTPCDHGGVVQAVLYSDGCHEAQEFSSHPWGELSGTLFDLLLVKGVSPMEAIDDGPDEREACCEAKEEPIQGHKRCL